MITKSSIKSSLIPWTAIGLILFLSHFVLATEFGLYEDDYFYMLPRITENFREFTTFFFYTLMHPSQGRPLFGPLQGALAYFGYHAGGLPFCHLISFGFLWVSAVLLYQLVLRKLSLRAAFLGSLLLVLFPLDTSRQILMHQMATVIPLTILLCAFHLYVSHRFFLSYLMAAIPLFAYESMFLPFIVAPFFLEDQPKRLIKSFVIHAVIFVAIIGIVFGSRALIGEPRALETSSHLSEEIPKIFWSCVANPALGVWAMVARPIDALMHSRAEGVVIAAVVGLTTFLVLRLFRGDVPVDLRTKRMSGHLIVCAGVIAWITAYVLDFRPDYYPPGVTIGRLSAMHGIAGFGGGLVLAGIAAILSDLLPPLFRIGFDICGALFIAGF